MWRIDGLFMVSNECTGTGITSHGAYVACFLGVDENLAGGWLITISALLDG